MYRNMSEIHIYFGEPELLFRELPELDSHIVRYTVFSVMVDSDEAYNIRIYEKKEDKRYTVREWTGNCNFLNLSSNLNEWIYPTYSGNINVKLPEATSIRKADRVVRGINAPISTLSCMRHAIRKLSENSKFIRATVCMLY